MTLEEIRFYSNYFQWAGSGLIFVSCLPLFKKRNTYIKILFYYSLSSILFQTAQQISISVFKNRFNNTIGDGFVFFEALILGFLFWKAADDTKFRKAFALAIIFYVVYYTIVLIFFNYNSFSLFRFGRDFELILLSLGFFYYLILKLPEENLLQYPMFWISAVSLFYFSGTSILSLMLDYIVKVLGDELNGFWTFRNFFRFTFCLILTYAVWLDWRMIKPNKS